MAIDKDLSAPLDPRRVQSREGSGGKRLSYLTTHDVKRTANRIFGYDGWSYVVDDLISLGEEPFKNSKGREGIRVGYRAVVTVTVGDVRRGDVGYGDAQEYNQSRITPHELASKEAVSDALKRCLSSWGDQFGLVLYGADPAPEPVEESLAASLPSSATAGAAGDVLNDAVTVSADSLLEHKRATEAKSTITLREPDQEFITDGQFKKLGEIAGPKGYKMSGDQFRDVIEEAIGTRDARKIKRYQFDAVLKAVELAGRGIEA